MAIKNKRLKLLRGSTYTFDVSDPSLSTHPLKFTADSGATEYTDGITLTGTQGQSGASISFVVPANAPNNLNYYCGTHGLRMGNHILIPAVAGGGGGGGGGGGVAANGFIVRNNFTGMSNERFYSIGTDTSNNFYATGYDAVDDNILIAKYNSSGTFQWARKHANAGNGPDRIFGSHVDTSGNVITGGYTYSHSGGSPYPTLITKYQPDGTEVYTKVFTDGGTSSWIGQATAIDSNDNFYITGRGGSYSSANNNDYTFVAKLNSAGAIVWIQKLDHTGQQSNGRAIAIDSNNDVIVAGAIHEQITGGGYSSGFVVKLSGTDGSIIWQKILNDDVQANGYHSDSFYAVTVDSNDDVYTTGWNNFEYLNTYYTPVVKLSGTDGSVTWQRRHLTTNGSTGISAIGTDVYVVTDDNTILIYNTSGTLTGEWEVTATGSGSYYTEDVKPDQNGNAVIVGMYFDGSSGVEPFFAVLPATIIAGTSDNFVLTAGTLGDVAGTLATNAFTTMSSNAASNVTVSNASNMASSTQASDGNVITPITGGTDWSGGVILSQLPANSSGLSSDFADDGRMATNGTYTVVGDPRMNIGNINQPGWAWIYRNSDGKEMASFNSILDGHAPNDSQLYSRNGNGAYASSKYHKMYFGQRVAINDTYAFVTAPISYSSGESNWGNGQDGSGFYGNGNNAYVSVIRLSDMTHVRTIKMMSTMYASGPSYVAGGTNWGGSGIAATNDWLAIGASHADVGSGFNSDYNQGSIEVFDITDSDPANWTSTRVDNMITTYGQGTYYSNYFNFGYGVAIEGNKLASNFKTLLQTHSYNGTNWVSGVNNTNAFPNGNSGPNNLFIKNSKVYASRTTGSPNYNAYIEVRDFATLTLQSSTQITEGNAYPGYDLQFDDSDHIFTNDGGYNDGNANAGRIMAYTLDSSTHVTNFDTQSLQGQASTDNYYGSTFAVSKGWLISKENNPTTSPATEYVTIRNYRSALLPPPSTVPWGGNRALRAGRRGSGSAGLSVALDYWNISVTGNASDFGDCQASSSSSTNNDHSASNGTRALVSRNGSDGDVNNAIGGSYDYFTVAVPGNSSTFGNALEIARSGAGLGDGTYAVFAGGYIAYGPTGTGYRDDIDYFTIATTGNATSFGSLQNVKGFQSGAGNATRGTIWGGQVQDPGPTYYYDDAIEYITIASPGNSSSFGNMSEGSMRGSAASDETRAVCQLGNAGPNYANQAASNKLEYITVATTGNTTDFGDINPDNANSVWMAGACENETRICFSGGRTEASGTLVNAYSNQIQYITTQTTGNATDFGDLLTGIDQGFSSSGNAA